ncbi:hypothetical protein OIU85_004377 [Salix viminalis]|uniref:AB hydrolase-1 domain-containing protein n=1 Tax=Salix viminalis TaxID=40686 RepID=A0A9Q0PSF6_SALVM|nr:hypothetical protein OIU85_004377 [Salix viminalis]
MFSLNLKALLSPTNPSSPFCNAILSNCKILHSRFVATPWISSPHFQTAFLQFCGRSPGFSYRRQLFHTSDGGTIALDWLMNADVSGGAFHINGASLPMNNSISQDETTPIVIVVPGLASSSTSHYLKNLAFNMAKHRWNVVVSNHRGLGGVSITSDCFYNAGWTEDLRAVANYLHAKYPKAPLFAIGTSIGANILVKYLGEDGEGTPIAGAVAVCNPWDLLIGDRFICRGLLQRIYDKALTIGLQGYAHLHEPLYTRLANWEGIKTARCIRDYDNYATCPVGKFETVDTYYRRCSSAAYVGNVSVPLLCISALDDPVCTREAIPWDECRANPNIVLATPQHGGHLAFFEGLTASTSWWIRAVDEFLDVLRSSPYIHVQKKQTSGQLSALDSSIDQYPRLHGAEDGIVTAASDDEKRDGIEDIKKLQMLGEEKTTEMLSNAEQEKHITGANSDFVSETCQTPEIAKNIQGVKSPDIDSPFRRFLNQMAQRNSIAMWLLAFIAIRTSWPLVGSITKFISRKRSRKIMPAA